MKTKLSILIALVMAISLLLTPAVAVAGVGSSTVVLGGDVAVASGAQGTTDESHIGSGSWEAVKGQKMELYIAPTVFPFNNLGSFTINDIASISFATKNAGTLDHVDFYFTIYTEPDEVDDETSWYGYRLTGEAMYSLTYTPVPDQWNVWTTTAGLNEVVFANFPRTPIGFYGQPTLADLQAGSLDWSDYPNSGTSDIIDYGVETVKYITFATGAPWYDTFEGYIDEITIVLTDGTSLTIDLESDVGSASLGAELEGIIAISVTPSIINFGTITPGNPLPGPTITVTNIGTETADISAVLDPLTGTVFNYLMLGGSYSPSHSGEWGTTLIAEGLVPTGVEELTTSLAPPATYSAQGQESATLIFEATGQ